MQKVWPKAINNSILTLLIAVSLWSCETYNEGCMDANATNYSFGNEKPCCCTYPTIIFQTTMKVDNSLYSSSDTMYSDEGQGFFVNEIYFIPSDVELTTREGNLTKPSDTLITYLVDSDILPVKVSKINSAGSTYLPVDSIDRLSFKIQDNRILNQYKPADFPLDHVFRDSSLYDFTTEQWHYLQLRIKPIDSEAITLTFNPAELNITSSISGKWGKTKGNNLTLLFSVHLDILFQGVSFSESQDEMKTKIIQNFPLALKI